MKIFSFGDYSEELGYNILDERRMRGSAGIMLLLAIIASINGFVLRNYEIIPYLTGFLMVNFIIGIFINPKFAPTHLLSSLMVRKQSALPIGAIQKRFAWGLGLTMVSVIFVLSLFLQNDASYFEPVCGLCMICIILLYLESVFPSNLTNSLLYFPN